MNSVRIRIINGYGINKIDHVFPFSATTDHPHMDTNIVYAQNGVMKSSFAKALRDYTTMPDTPIRDHIFEIAGSCEVTDENGKRVLAEQILSIPSFESTNGYECKNMGALVVKADLKAKYDTLMEPYDIALESVVGKLKTVSSVKGSVTQSGIISLVCSSFQGAPVSEASFVNLLRANRAEIDSKPDYIQKLKFSVIGEPYVQTFAENNKDFLQEFLNRLNKVLSSASYLRGEFGTGNAQLVADTLDKQKFFKADHSVVLIDESDPSNPVSVPVGNADELKNLFETDFDRVFADNPSLKTKFKKVLGKIDQANHKELKDILVEKETRPVIALMARPEIFKRNLWLGYLKGCVTEIDELLKIQGQIKDAVAAIVQQANKEKTAWDETVLIFKQRFSSLPFEVEIENKSSIILEGVSEPQLCYYYKHPTLPRKRIEHHDKLTPSLSAGEKKAFYLLNLIFEVNVKRQAGVECLMVLDDIVDSFDYKNKYAFMEYIHEISRDYTNIKFIILTHNFDFFRLMQFRLFGDKVRSNSWLATRNNTDISLREAGQFNLFRNTRDNASRHKKAWLSLIPFARNLIEYQVDDEMNDPDYMALTRCLHTLGTSPTVAEIKVILGKHLNVSISPLNDTQLVREAYSEVADEIEADVEPQLMDIQNKLVLAIASRLTCENYMRSKLTPEEQTAAEADKSPLTRALGMKYMSSITATEEGKITLDRLNLMTPENIHINAFMYEPLIDIGQHELSDLYTKMKTLT